MVQKNLKVVFYEKKKTRKKRNFTDPVYNDILVAKFINYIMERGKKGIAEKIFYGSMELIKKRNKNRWF